MKQTNMKRNEANMAARYEREIPEGYEARIEGNKVIIELKESEDERIRKFLVEVINKYAGVSTREKEQCLAYLEKQKEQKPNIEICPHSIRSKSYKENGYPIEDCDYGLEIALDILEKTLGKVQGFQTDDGIREHQTAIKAVKEAMKEQKPVEIHIDNPNIQKFDADMKITTSDSSADGKELLYVSNKSYNIGFRDGVASVKPVEWSENDKRILNEAIGMIGAKGCWVRSDDAVKQVSDFLKSLLSRPKTSDNWKPNEEQMEALHTVAYIKEIDYYGGLKDRLRELYEQLKRL